MRTPQVSVVRVRVRQGSGFHTMAELYMLSLRVVVANHFVIAGRFITDNREHRTIGRNAHVSLCIFGRP